MLKLKNHIPLCLVIAALLIMVPILFFTAMVRASLPIPSPGVVFEFNSGVGVKTLANQLVENEVISSPRLFEWYTRFNRYDKTMQAGEYYFPQGISMRGVVNMLRYGHVIKRAFRVQEGWTVHDLIAAIEAQPLLKHDVDFTEPKWYKSVSENIEHPEGQFMPETYFYTKDTSDLKLLKRMHVDLTTYLNAQWEARAEDLPFKDSYQALIAASIIEKETGLPSEREAVSGVLVRRLNKNMRLQMDPTVIYGIGPTFDGNITKKDLRADTPYNTYVIDGLPPTPISLPSKQSIHAAMHPLEGTSLYFVSKGDGSHTFSDTLEDHNSAVTDFLKGNPSP